MIEESRTYEPDEELYNAASEVLEAILLGEQTAENAVDVHKRSLLRKLVKTVELEITYFRTNPMTLRWGHSLPKHRNWW